MKPASTHVAVEEQSGLHVQFASLDDRVFWSPTAADVRFAALAPTVARATLALTAPAIAPAPAQTPQRLEASKATPPLPPKRRTASEARTPARPSPLARVDGAVKKIVKSIGALRLPRVKLTALNSPHAAGPRRP